MSHKSEPSQDSKPRNSGVARWTLQTNNWKIRFSTQVLLQLHTIIGSENFQ
jgi:hypothetical protein